MSQTQPDDFEFFGSNTTAPEPTNVATDDAEEEQKQQPTQQDDLFGEFSSEQTEQQNYAAPEPTTDALFDTNAYEDIATAPTTEKDPFDQELNDSTPPTNNEQWNTEETQKEPPTAEEILSSSSPVAEDPKLTEQQARVQAINRRIEEELAARDEAEARRKADLLQQAKQDLERWYQERDRQMNEKRQKIKSEEDTLRTWSLEKSDKGQCDWAKLIRLLEFGPTSHVSKSKRDLSRMKASIINAKRHVETQKASNSD